MFRKLMRAGIAAALSAAALVLTYGALTAANAADKPTIDEIMKKNHNKKAGAFPKIQKLIEEGQFDKAAPLAKDLAANGAKLQSVKPEKGDEKSWEKMSKAYAVNTKAVSEAVEKKDAAAAKASAKTLQGSCKACHDAHRN